MLVDKIYPVILCGGTGSRLWPLSRKSYPKQFTLLKGEQTLFQQTAQRLSGAAFNTPLVVTGEDFRFLVVEQLAAIHRTAAEIIVEPSSKNTAAAVCAAALALDAHSPNALMLVAPSDHLIPDIKHFQRTVISASQSAMEGQIVTFGIQPTRPETGYGWLEPSQAKGDYANGNLRPLKRFIEKPDLAIAKTMYSKGDHFWNAGLFLFTTSRILQAFERHQPEILKAVEMSTAQARKDLSFTRLDMRGWEKLPNISIDRAIMECAINLSVMPFDGEWSDLGDWQALWRESEADDTGVVVDGASTSIDCKDTFLKSTHEAQEIVGIGLDNIVAIATPDAVLVANKQRTQDVGRAVSLLRSKGSPQAESAPIDHRPWGWCESLTVGEKFQVKRISVKPKASLSLQSHKHRAEHWVVVEGLAKVTIENQTKLVEENNAIFIPVGSVHRLENPGETNLTLIEIQTGNYLGEDDIVRYQDLYART